MTPEIMLLLDGREVTGRQGQTILEVADTAGVYIPRLCHEPSLEPYGGCRVCTVLANGRSVPACTQPASLGMVVEIESDELAALRRDIVEMLLVEGNHFCMFCERSGACELQALAYRLGIPAPTLPHAWPERDVDATHPDVLVDHDRCVLCGRCVRASRDLDGKHVFGFLNRGARRRVGVDAEGGLGGTDLEATDKAADSCPVGALLHKRVGHVVPIGRRPYDREPIGSDIEARGTGGEG
jgi:[NiFe] hydrogenase diaphorase moiety small subunit